MNAESLAYGVVSFLAGFLLAYAFLTLLWHVDRDVTIAASWICGTVWARTL